MVALDRAAYLADRGPTVDFVGGLLAATASRPAFTGCFGLHEWAMVYRQQETRHDWPLRLGPEGTDAVVTTEVDVAATRSIVTGVAGHSGAAVAGTACASDEFRR